MRYGSVCSGIEAASVAWEPIGWVPEWFAEIEKEPSEILNYHWPWVDNLGDMTKIAAAVTNGNVKAPDVLVGGTPCQAFSVAGARKGMADDRGALTIKYVELADAIDAKRITEDKPESIIVWENVPGVLSSKDNAFGCFLGLLCGEDDALHPSGKKWPNAGCVFGPKRTVVWRVLDAQYFGVAQRRRRVFVVASARTGFRPEKVLFESEGMRRDTAPRREAREEITGTLTARASDGGGLGDLGYVGGLQPVKGYRMAAFGEYSDDETASTMKARDYKDATDLAVVPLNLQVITRHEALGRATGFGLGAPNEPAYTLQAGHMHGVWYLDVVRRLTTTECERLQGFPDGHTAVIRSDGSVMPDSHRYKALGNSMAVPVMRWIGERISEELAYQEYLAAELADIL